MRNILLRSGTIQSCQDAKCSKIGKKIFVRKFKMDQIKDWELYFFWNATISYRFSKTYNIFELFSQLQSLRWCPIEKDKTVFIIFNCNNNKNNKKNWEVFIVSISSNEHHKHQDELFKVGFSNYFRKLSVSFIPSPFWMKIDAK